MEATLDLITLLYTPREGGALHQSPLEKKKKERRRETRSLARVPLSSRTCTPRDIIMQAACARARRENGIPNMARAARVYICIIHTCGYMRARASAPSRPMIYKDNFRARRAGIRLLFRIASCLFQFHAGIGFHEARYTALAPRR